MASSSAMAHDTQSFNSISEEPELINPKDAAVTGYSASREPDHEEYQTSEHSEDDAFNESDHEESPSPKQSKDDVTSSDDLPAWRPPLRGGSLAENVRVKRDRRLRTAVLRDAESKAEPDNGSESWERSDWLWSERNDWKASEDGHWWAQDNVTKMGCAPYRSRGAQSTWQSRCTWNDSQWSSGAWESSGWQASARSNGDRSSQPWGNASRWPRSKESLADSKAASLVPPELVKAVLFTIKGAWHDKSDADLGIVKSYEIAADATEAYPSLRCRTWIGDSEVESEQTVCFENGDIFLGKDKRMYLDVVSELYATWVDEKQPDQKVLWTRGWAPDRATLMPKYVQAVIPSTSDYKEAVAFEGQPITQFQ